jgi:hypothetical protein
MTPQSVAIEVAHWLIGGPSWPQFPPPPELPPTFAPLQKVLNDTLKDRQFANRFADLGVVVLNFGPVGDPYQPPTAAYNRHTVRVEVGSVGKLAIAYAACQLKADVELVLNQVAAAISPAAPTLSALPRPLSDYWSSIPALKKRSLSVPDLKKLFDDPVQIVDGSGSRWAVSFKGMSNCGYAADWATIPARKQVIDKLCTAHQYEHEGGSLAKWQAKIDACSFAEHLWLETRWSDNLAATQTAIDIARASPDSADAGKSITLAYIQALLKESGLGDVDRGFWLNGAYQEPLRPPPPPPLVLWGQKPWHPSDAQSLARLMIALANGELISPSASAELASFLRHLEPLVDLLSQTKYVDLDDPAGAPKPVNWVDSFILSGIPKAARSCLSKIGVEAGLCADVALVEVEIGGGPPQRLGIVVVNAGEKSGGSNGISLFARTLLANLNLPGSTAALARS